MRDLLKEEQLIDASFKDASPIKTVEKIKGILNKYGLETEEYWLESNVPFCYSLYVQIKGTNFRVSGKGLTREYALASGYGELIERFQLGFVGKLSIQKEGAYETEEVDSVAIPAKELLQRNRDWYEKIAQRVKEWNGTDISPESILLQYADKNGEVLCTPFINLVNGKKEFLPVEMRKETYTSNGCAAGNSFEEACVQAIGEIIERYYRIEIINRKICTPEIPEEKLEQCKIAYEIINYIRKQGYRVIVKDCSLGTKFPMVCVCYVDEKTGKYHTHFGAAPIFEIALERALTETFQGREIGSFAEYADLFINVDENKTVSNMTKELISGTSARKPEFFIGTPIHKYNEGMEFSGKNNKELLTESIAFFRDMGCDVLVRDASCLGFPTCQVIIPGYSETRINRFSKNTNEIRYLPHAIKTLRNPSNADLADILGTVMHMNETNLFFPHNVRRLSFLFNARLMADLTDEEDRMFLLATMAYVHYAMRNFSAVEKNIADMLKLKCVKYEEFLICLKRYLSMKISEYSADKIRETLEFLHNRETINKLYGYIETNQNPMDMFVLHCDMQCGDNCAIKDRCYQKNAKRLIDIVNQAEKEMSFDDFCAYVKSTISV